MFRYALTSRVQINEECDDEEPLPQATIKTEPDANRGIPSCVNAAEQPPGEAQAVIENREPSARITPARSQAEGSDVTAVSSQSHQARRRKIEDLKLVLEEIRVKRQLLKLEGEDDE